MSQALIYSHVIDQTVLIGDQIAKSISGQLAMLSDPDTSVSWVQTGILGIIVLATVYGFKSGFLALGRELERERELSRDHAKTIRDQAKIIEDQRNLIAAVIMQSGRTLPVLTETARQVATEKDQQTERILGMMDELKEAITHGPTG